jgi:Ca-activated chloride channel family protein
MRSRRRLAAFIPLLIALSSCADLNAKLLLVEGNFYYARGLSNQAIAAYLKAAAYPQTKAYAEFGLGSTYYALDEREAALKRFSEAEAAAEKPEHHELLYRIRYNSGIIQFENGRYDAAAARFKEALEADASRVEAKRNLELSLLAREQHEGGGEDAKNGKETRENAKTEALFHYLREKESRQWQSREWIEDAPAAGPDY